MSLLILSHSLQGVLQGQLEGDVHSGRYHYSEELQETSVGHDANATQKTLGQLQYR